MNGECNCRKVKVVAKSNVGSHICHCGNCRKHTGAVSSSFLDVQMEDFSLEGREHVKVFKVTGDGGSTVGRYFCGECGSSIYTEVEGIPMAYVSAGLFPVGSVPTPGMHLFGKNMEKWEPVVPGAEVKQMMEGL